MSIKRKKMYSDDLLNITDSFLIKLEDIEKKLSNDYIINQGLFLMITVFFEDSIRELMKKVLIQFPEKLTNKSCVISREQVCLIASNGHSVIIDNELYLLFKDGVRRQLENLLKILFNKEYKKASCKKSISENEKNSIAKLEEISLYRNALVHNAGRVSIEINEKVKYFKPKTQNGLLFDSELIKLFIDEYKKFFQHLSSEIKITFSSCKDLSEVDKTKVLWDECFSSPTLQFEDYWEIDREHDLIKGVKYPEVEKNISSSEKVFLSIWRHQFDDSIKTEEFLLCSINYSKIHMIYKGLYDLKFYYMKQKADRYKSQP